MEALLLFQTYRVWDLKASQITMRRNNDVLGLFFTWYIQVVIGFWARQQFSLPESRSGPWRLAACYQSRSIFLWRSWTAVAGEGEKNERRGVGRWERGKQASKQGFLIGPNQVQASRKKHFCSKTYYYFDPSSTLLMVYVSKDLWRTLRSLPICPPPVTNWWWICGHDVYSLTNSNKLCLVFFVLLLVKIVSSPKWIITLH